MQSETRRDGNYFNQTSLVKGMSSSTYNKYSQLIAKLVDFQAITIVIHGDMLLGNLMKCYS